MGKSFKDFTLIQDFVADFPFELSKGIRGFLLNIKITIDYNNVDTDQTVESASDLNLSCLFLHSKADNKMRLSA